MGKRPRLPGIIDAHSSDGMKFPGKKDEFAYLGSLHNRYMEVYAKNGWDGQKLPFRTDVDGAKPIISDEEAERERRLIQSALEKAKPDSCFGIEALDSIITAKDAEWLAGIALKQGVSLKVQLTYNHQNHLATGCRAWDASAQQYDGNGGLSRLGKEVAAILMSSGIVIDVSHLNRQSTLDVCSIGREIGKPVIASHSNALQVFALGKDGKMLKDTDRAAARCLSDEEIDAVLSTGGYVGITPHPAFLSIDSRNWLMERYEAMESGKPQVAGNHKKEWRGDALALLIQHIAHVRKVASDAGYDPMRSTALSMDIEKHDDGSLVMPRGYSEGKYLRIFSDLARELAKEGWGEKEIGLLFHGNVKRVFEKVGANI